MTNSNRGFLFSVQIFSLHHLFTSQFTLQNYKTQIYKNRLQYQRVLPNWIEAIIVLGSSNYRIFPRCTHKTQILQVERVRFPSKQNFRLRNEHNILCYNSFLYNSFFFYYAIVFFFFLYIIFVLALS